MMMKFIDMLLLAAWKILIFAGRCIVLVLSIIFSILKSFFRYMERFEWFANFADNLLFNYLSDAEWPGSAMDGMSRGASRFSAKMKSSCVFRRGVFLTAALSFILYV